MSAQPMWSAVDDETADLLTLVADAGHVSSDYEWNLYVAALRQVANANEGRIEPNALRPLVAGHVAPKRLGAFANRAVSQDIVSYTGEWQISNDVKGRNSGKPARIMQWVGGVSR